MNRVEMTGKLVRDPEFYFTRNGWPLLRFTIVTDGRPRYDPELKESIAASNFIGCIMFGPMAEWLAESGMEKGEDVYVLGELDQSEMERKDGTKESKTRVKVLHLVRLDVPPIRPIAEPSF